MKYEHCETWSKLWCPHCQKINWFCDGNLDDDTRYAACVEAIECRHCQTNFWVIDFEDSEYHSYVEEHEDDDGLTVPGLTPQQILDEYAVTEMGRPPPQ